MSRAMSGSVCASDMGPPRGATPRRSAPRPFAPRWLSTHGTPVAVPEAYRPFIGAIHVVAGERALSVGLRGDDAGRRVSLGQAARSAKPACFREVGTRT